MQTSTATLEIKINPILEGVYVILQRTQHVYGIAALVTVSRKRDHPRRPSTDEWIMTVWYIHTAESYSTLKKDGVSGTIHGT